MGLLWVGLTVLLTVYGQLIIKWQVTQAGSLPVSFYNKIFFLLKLLCNPWILSGFLSAFLASLFWMLAMSRLQLSYAYPFVSLSFVLVIFFSYLFFSEPLTWQKMTGIAFISMGVIFISYRTLQ